MTYNILLIKDNKTDNAEKAKRLLEEVGRKFSRSFAFEYCDLSSNSEEIIYPAKLAPQNSILRGPRAGVCGDPEIIKKAKSAHAVLLDGCTPALRGICKELALYASVRIIGDVMLVNDAFGGIYDGEKGFRSNPTFGREAYDEERYSELEIERVARIAYELSPARHITLIDKADELATSKLWRKIVTDINEDYPFVNVDMASIESALSAILQAQSHTPDTLLTSHLFGDIIYSALSAKADKAKFSALLGDTTLGMYVLPNGLLSDNQQSKCDEIVKAVAFMLRHSFDMQAEADYLERL